MMRLKGRLVAGRKVKKSTEEERRARTLERSKEKLGIAELNRVQTLFKSLNVVGNKSRSVLNGLIIGLLQRNLSHYEIRAITGVGGPRVKRIECIMKNLSLLNKKRPRPHHAVTPEDLNNLKRDLQK